jgi:hypothetical protein
MKIRVACIAVDSMGLAKLFLFSVDTNHETITARIHLRFIEDEVENRGYFGAIAFDENDMPGQMIHLKKRSESQFEEIHNPLKIFHELYNNNPMEFNPDKFVNKNRDINKPASPDLLKFV